MDKKGNIVTGILLFLIFAAVVVFGSLLYKVSKESGTKQVKGEAIIKKHLKMMEKLHKEKKYYQAFTAVKRAFELDPENGDLQFNVLREKAFVLANNPWSIDRKQAADLLYDVEFLLENDKDNKSVYLTARGNIKLALNRKYEEIVGDFKEALKLDNKNFMAHLQLARLYSQKKEKINDAIKEYEEALKLNPKSFHALAGLGDIYLYQQKYSKALEKYKEAKKLGNNYNLNLNMGVAYFNLKDLKNALSSFNEAKTINNRDITVYRWIARIFINAKQWKEAENELRAALQLRKDSDIYFNLGVVLSRQKKYKEAMDIFNTLLRINPDNVYVLYEAATLLDNARNFRDALTLYKKLNSMKNLNEADQKWLAGVKPVIDKRIKAIEEIMKKQENALKDQNQSANQKKAKKK